jgi:hypothetical protein
MFVRYSDWMVQREHYKDLRRAADEDRAAQQAPHQRWDYRKWVCGYEFVGADRPYGLATAGGGLWWGCYTASPANEGDLLRRKS